MAQPDEQPQQFLDGEPVLDAPVAADVPAPTQPEPRVRPVPWPANVPDQEESLLILHGSVPHPEGLPGARRLQETLTPPERDVLEAPGLLDALSNGLVLRWRLAAAADLMPPPGVAIDKDALNVLLAEVDRALDALRTAEAGLPELALSVDTNWEKLATEAVKLSERIHAVPAPEPVPVPPRSTGEKAAITGKLTFTSTDVRTGSRPKALYVVLALTLLGVGAYHASSLFEPPAKEPTVPGAPPGLMVVGEPRSGMMRVLVSSGQPANPEQLAWLRQQVTEGWQLKELGPGSYVVLPAPATQEPGKVQR